MAGSEPTDPRERASARWAWLQAAMRDPTLSAQEARTAGLILTFTNHSTNTAWPSHHTLASLSGTTERTIIRAVRTLAERGYILVDARKGRGNTYRLNLEVVTPMSPLTPVSGVKDADLVGVVTPVSGGGDTSVRGVVTPMSHEPVDRTYQKNLGVPAQANTALSDDGQGSQGGIGNFRRDGARAAREQRSRQQAVERLGGWPVVMQVNQRDGPAAAEALIQRAVDGKVGDDEIAVLRAGLDSGSSPAPGSAGSRLAKPS